MAKRIEIDLELKSKIDSSRQIFNTLKEKDAFKNSPRASKTFESIIKELDSLSQVSEPTLKQLSRMNSLFNQMSDILVNAANSVNESSAEFKKIQETIDEIGGKLETSRKSKGKILKQGRINETTGNYELFDTYQTEQLQLANIIGSNGKQIKSIGTFRKKFDANGQAIAGAFQDPVAAQALYDKLKKHQEDNAINLAKLNEEIANYTTQLTEAKNKLTEQAGKEKSPIAGQVIENKLNFNQILEDKKTLLHTQKDLQKTTSRVEGLNNSLAKQSSALGNVFKQFTLYHLGLKFVKKALREAVQTIKELDQSLTEQAMVTGMTREQAYGLIKDYQDLALQVGATTKEIAGVATEYMKQGKTIEDSLKLTEAAVAAAKVARVSVGDSVNYLTTALNGFRLSAEDAMAVSDKFAAVAASSATDYDELAIALSKVASQANLAGMSIDYTTALLTKGLETTREAPETMGTALKTIIARMRELGDYGETLEGDTDINNVESQLSYVGIALRNTSGELRSTEDVLDELGKKWDTLNTNQQAALAKALAGTRQQSRLIAMMDDYERVIELQEISQRSAGATSAQAATYLEGMAASINKIQVGWEKIISSLTDSNIIVDTFGLVGTILEKIGDALDKTGWQVVVYTTLISLGAIVLGNKLRENDLAKEKHKLDVQEEILKEKQAIAAKQATIASMKDLIVAKQKVIEEKKETLEKEKQRQLDLKAKKAKEGLTAEEEKELKVLNMSIGRNEKALKLAEDEYNDAKTKLPLLEKEVALRKETLFDLQSQLGITGKLMTAFSGIRGLLLTFKPIYAIIAGLQTLIVKKKREELATTLKTQAAEAKGLKKKLLNAGVKMAESASAMPVVGWVIAIALLAAVGIGIGVAIHKQNQYNKSAEKTSEDISELSNKIYKMNEASTAIQKTISDFDALDSKIVKTKEDLEEMNELLDAAAESIDFTQGGKLSEEEAERAKQNYLGMTETQQLAELEKEKERLKAAMQDARESQMAKLAALSESDRNNLLNNDSSVSSAVFARNNAQLYEEIDALEKINALTKEQADLVEDLGERILSNLSAEEAYAWAQEGKIVNLTKQLSQLGSIEVKGKESNTASIIEVLTSGDYLLTEQIKAYEEAIKNLDSETAELLKTEYSALDAMSKWDDVTTKMVEKLGLTAEKVNNITKAMSKIGVETDALTSRFMNLMNNVSSSGNDIENAITTTFGDLIKDINSDEGKKLYNTILNAYAEATGVGILNMGQNLDKLNNTINDFYKKAAEWSTMSKAEQTQFLNDNAKLFNNNAELLEAFESGNYQAIEEALKNSDALQKQVDDRIAEIEQELALERAKLVEDQNTAYIKMLKEELEYLNNSEELFEVSLETQLKQQEEQLNTYKEYLQEQKDALEDSLNKRKEAYEKYFDAINRDEEDEEYDEQANTLISNLSKLSSSTNADAKKQSKELENQLKELEEERLKTLRERAQEAVIENMDDTLDEINNKFDELINNNKALLAAMQGDLTNGEGFIANLMTDKINNGATALELESFWKELESTYGSVLTGVDWDSFKASESGNSMFLNVNGQTIELSPGNQQSVYEVIMKALKQVGVS